MNPAQCCLECGSREYVFRGMKKIAAEARQPVAVETNYMCRSCGHAWKERVAARCSGRLTQRNNTQGAQMKWRVILNGDSLELKLLAESFTKSDCLIRQEDSMFTLSSAEFESLNHFGKISEYARQLIERINGSLVLIFGSNTPVTSGGVYELQPDGGRNVYASMHAQVHCRTFATATIVRADGSVEETRPADPVREWTGLAAGDKAVATVLSLLGTKTADWVNLYRIYEIVDEDSGGIERRRWATKTTIRNFKHTANHPEVTGLDSRHGRMSGDPPKKPMLLGEAKSLIYSITLAWLREK